MTPSGIKPATFRLVAQFLNQLRRHREPPSDQYNSINVVTCIYFLYMQHVSADNFSHHQAILQKYERYN
jgi:hypothetical protein